jgi:transposase InsO family protein
MTVADSLPAAGNAWGERMETPEDVAVMLRFSEMGWGGEADRVRARLQTAIDCHSRYAWARLYPNKLPVTAGQLLNNDVLPTFEAHQARIEVVLSDNGREFCGRDDHHPYELFLQLEGIAHKCTRVKRPQSNGIVERLHPARRTLPRRGPQNLVRDHRRDADRPR